MGGGAEGPHAWLRGAGPVQRPWPCAHAAMCRVRGLPGPPTACRADWAWRAVCPHRSATLLRSWSRRRARSAGAGGLAGEVARSGVCAVGGRRWVGGAALLSALRSAFSLRSVGPAACTLGQAAVRAASPGLVPTLRRFPGAGVGEKAKKAGEEVRARVGVGAHPCNAFLLLCGCSAVYPRPHHHRRPTTARPAGRAVQDLPGHVQAGHGADQGPGQPDGEGHAVQLQALGQRGVAGAHGAVVMLPLVQGLASVCRLLYSTLTFVTTEPPMRVKGPWARVKPTATMQKARQRSNGPPAARRALPAAAAHCH